MNYQLKKDFYPYYTFKHASSTNVKGDIFFIHGYAVNANYHNYFSDLVNNYNYYAVELPGHGITPLQNKKQLSPYHYACEIVELIKSLKLKDIYLIGHSMGGGIACMVSKMIPDLIKKMVIVTPMNSSGAKNAFNFLFNFNPRNEKKLHKFYNIVLHNYEDVKHRIDENEKVRLLKNQAQFKSNYRKLKWNIFSVSNLIIMKRSERNLLVPTLLLVGKDDGCINYKSAINNFKKHNENIEIYCFQQSGHIPFFEQTELYFEKIMHFFNHW